VGLTTGAAIVLLILVDRPFKRVADPGDISPASRASWKSSDASGVFIVIKILLDMNFGPKPF
jgi:hypothetical protein